MASSERTPFVEEARRLMDARLAATSPAEKDDAEWALTYLFQMNRADRLEEYFAMRAEQVARNAGQ